MDENVLLHKLIEILEYKNFYQFETSNIQPQDMYILERVYFSEKLKVKDISKKYNIPASTATGIIDRLEAKNYVKRIRNNVDRRTVELIITEDGKLVVDSHINEDKMFAHNLFNTLEKDKKEVFKQLLIELIKNVKKDQLFKPN
ncbi:transcriptional regulator, MarR family [Clostridium pasteurianum DSM 525 = ATCC 6013]|uniref:Transcriptional regulator, MarR family n=1 Tax=Clostridium pasteurianum DSM 525 = ATCC 6013 TaxID=1262449 RepID=A0A0H3JB82_CLOPA|nr:MarR family transcriptional regulator [Clostridium pasteurianum]AJA49275.1 transcriptional regulator, MarR family [Clostridium pasteurianum DSM 525 = ATCC 6013]AJA53263.1 transcriptional regulator, MarR family [Clostridium pasteurianum DSM 525 = ATCC 6013]AOZ76453.1 transcriptional regulator [Clostridium pasteurianum DSM 525 = ATCC 6013]AOZ80250.1 transcriptional regulator [Clostridium pasteurianum]ELP58295.1 MarR family transcriptional regulator [Clostridium pasteurianum DSM 525 = ATCC 601